MGEIISYETFRERRLYSGNFVREKPVDDNIIYVDDIYSLRNEIRKKRIIEKISRQSKTLKF